jgi:ABC-type antimicrobial peptide transport system permease subunit
MAMRTGRRTREVGVRMALGATRAHVRRQLVVEQFVPVAAGLAVGSAGAVWASTVLRSYLYKPPSYDWSAWIAAVILIIAAALIGISIPAWKASRIEPVTALRQD